MENFKQIDPAEIADNFIRAIGREWMLVTAGNRESWAEGVLAQLLGHAPSPEEIAEAVTAGERTRETLRKSAEDDRARDCSPAMAVGYGVDADSEEEKMQDYHTVRGIR